MHLSLSARERLDLNLSTTFAELAITTMNKWNQEGDAMLQKPRGIYAPYRIRNRTGTPIFVWSDSDTAASAAEGDMTKVLNDQTIDWRFDDWKTMREVADVFGISGFYSLLTVLIARLFWPTQHWHSIC